jgi:glycosyltransferase involved in cell wall biosynthesis
MTGAPLTILQVTHSGEGAGSTQSIASLSQYLARRGHHVLVGCRPDTVLARLTRDAGLEAVPLDFRRLGSLARALAGVIAARGVQVVNSHDTRDRRALTWLRWRGRLPQAFVATRRTMPLTSPAELIAVGATADRTIAVSATVARALRRRLYPAARLRVVENGIDLARVDAPPPPDALARAREAVWGGAGARDARPVIVIVARRKRQDVVLRALARLERPVVLACVGIEPDRQLAALAAAVPARHRVVFVPFTEQALPFYHLAAVAALPSTIEGLSQALLEAMALGVPVVASQAGGNTDLVTSGATGLLVPTADVPGWAAALERLLGDAALAGRLAAAGRDLVRTHYTLERTAERTEAVYLEALTRRG